LLKIDIKTAEYHYLWAV